MCLWIKTRPTLADLPGRSFATWWTTAPGFDPSPCFILNLRRMTSSQSRISPMETTTHLQCRTGSGLFFTPQLCYPHRACPAQLRHGMNRQMFHHLRNGLAWSLLQSEGPKGLSLLDETWMKHGNMAGDFLDFFGGGGPLLWFPKKSWAHMANCSTVVLFFAELMPTSLQKQQSESGTYFIYIYNNPAHKSRMP